MFLFFVFLLIVFRIQKVLLFFVHDHLVHSFFLKYYICQNNICHLLRTIFVLLYGIYGIVHLYILPFLYSFHLFTNSILFFFLVVYNHYEVLVLHL